MHLDIFQNKLITILNYVDKLNRENIPINAQMILIKAYANDLSINLTSDMIFEILSYNFIHYSNYQIH